ncbi:MAG TPA: hypothetical protein VGB70_12915 [Allosphingosinicella sp.]|jgi:hypothetical protein
MSRVSEAQAAENRRAVERAKAVLKPGDRIRVTRCLGLKRTFTFDGWDGQWAVSRSGISDLHPASIDRLNGVPTTFRDPL